MLKKIITDKYKKAILQRCDYNPCFYYFSPADYPDMQAKEEDFKTKGDFLLYGNFYCYRDYNPDKIIVFVHGLGSGHLAYFREIELICKKGYLVYAYDQLGCGMSPGAEIAGLAGSLVDLDYCIRHLKDKYPHKKIIVIGHSWGGYAALNISSYHSDLAAVVSLSGFRSVNAMLSQQLHNIKYLVGICMQAERENCGSYADADALECLGACKCKTLVIHSANDSVVKYKKHYLTLAKKIDNPNVRFYSIDGKGHNPNYTQSALAYYQQFIKAYLKEEILHHLAGSVKQTEFKGKYDFKKMTEQDLSFWNTVFSFIEK